MAKLQVYKFVSPGAGKSSAPEVAAARQGLLATNRLGSTITGLGNQVVDINKITNLRVKEADKAEIADRRQRRKQMDAEAEALQEQFSTRYLSQYFKDQKKKKLKKNNIAKGAVDSVLSKTLGWIGPLLQPFIDLFVKIYATVALKELLDWASDEENIKKMTVFFEKTKFVFDKIYGFGKWIIGDNLITGFNQLFGKDESLIGRIKGLGKLMTGVIGLRYLMAPWKIITDILNMLNIITGGKIRPKPSPKPKPGQNFRPKVTTSTGRSAGPLSGIRETLKNLNPFKSKPKVTVSKPPSNTGNVLTRALDSIKKTFTKPKVTGNVVKPKFQLPKISAGSVLKSGATLGISIGLDWLVGLGFSLLEQKQIADKVKSFQRLSKEQQAAEIARYEQLVENQRKKTQGFSGVFENIITFGGLTGEGTNKKILRMTEATLTALKQAQGQVITNDAIENFNRIESKPIVEEKKEEPKKKKGLFGLGFFGLEHGGELPEYFIGGLFRGITRAVTGVVKGVTNVVKGVVNTVVDVVSNPIVNTALSFIPGIGPVVQAINAVSSLSQGNILGAITSGVGALGNFAAIGSTAKSVVDTPNWLMNLRMSKFGRGISNLYTKGANIFGKASNFLTNTVASIQNSRFGKIGMQLLQGNMGGAIGEVVGMFPGVSTNIENFGNWLEKNQLQGILGAVPGIRGLVSNVPNIMSIPGMAKILGGDGYQFSAMNAIGAVADKAGMKGIYNAILSGAQSGNYIDSLRELAPELGVDPRILGVLDKGRALLRDNKFNAEYAMQTAIEFLPVPLIVEKLIPAPTPVPINSGDTYLVAPSSTQSR